MCTDGREIIAARRFEKHFQVLVRRRLGLALGEERAAAVETKDRTRIRNRNVLDTRQTTKSILQLVQENHTLLVLFIFVSLKTHLRRHESIDLPARICIDEALQATQKQSGRREQDHCKRDFTDDQRVSQTVLRA